MLYLFANWLGVVGRHTHRGAGNLLINNLQFGKSADPVQHPGGSSRGRQLGGEGRVSLTRWSLMQMSHHCGQVGQVINITNDIDVIMGTGPGHREGRGQGMS